MPDDPTATFRTHSNYLRAMAMLAGKQLFRPDSSGVEAFGSRVTRSRQYGLLQRTSVPDLARVQKCLRNAWGSELLICLGDRYIQDDEVIRISNNWNVVMAYYAAFHGTHALLAAQAQPAPPDHAKLQNQFVATWTNRSFDLAPFTLGMTRGGWFNLPNGVSVDDSVHSWSNCTSQTCVSIAAKALKSTREEKIKDAYTRARDQKQRERNKTWREEDELRRQSGKRALKRDVDRGMQLKQHEKTSIEARLRTTSYLDYLYRLRIRSNYEDSTMFTDGPEDAFGSPEVRANLTYLTACILLMTELHVRELVGRQWFEAEARSWSAANLPAGPSGGIAARLPILFS